MDCFSKKQKPELVFHPHQFWLFIHQKDENRLFNFFLYSTIKLYKLLKNFTDSLRHSSTEKWVTCKGNQRVVAMMNDYESYGYNDGQHLFDFTLRGLLIFLKLALKTLIYLPHLFTAYLLATKLLDKQNSGLVWV